MKMSYYSVGRACLLTGFFVTSCIATAALSNEVSSLTKVLDTDLAKYLLSSEPLDPTAAQTACTKNGGNLLFIQNLNEFKRLIKSLKDKLKFPGDSLWTSGISFSNSTVANVLVWSNTNESISSSLEFHKKSEQNLENLKFASPIVRNRRSIPPSNDDCDCDCQSTPPPFPVPVCKKPTCDVQLPEGPPCSHIQPPTCSIVGIPNCSVTDRNCTVDCGPPCRIIEQPVCKVIEQSKERCRLEVPKCDMTTPNCTIIAPGYCKAIQEDCEKDDSDCEPVVKPCKNSCADQECTTVQPPCQTTTTQPPCYVTTPCAPHTTPIPCKMEEKCRKKRSQDKIVLQCETVPVCPNTTTTQGPITCRPIITCPPPTEVTTCAPPVTSCSRPFADCSPEICQSSVHVCLPPTYRCPPVRITCEQPKVHCEVQCPTEPEVVCDIPEISCTKPKVECPDAVVHCSPIMSTCENPPLSCTSPVASGCKEPTIKCGEPTICPSAPANAMTQQRTCTGCRSGCKRIRDVSATSGSSSDTEVINVERKLCIAINRKYNFKLDTQSCDQKKQFLCKIDKPENLKNSLF